MVDENVPIVYQILTRVITIGYLPYHIIPIILLHIIIEIRGIMVIDITHLITVMGIIHIEVPIMEGIMGVGINHLRGTPISKAQSVEITGQKTVVHGCHAV